MKIQVFMHENYECQEVPDYLLGYLINAGRVKAFRRSTGWVVIGRDPIRGQDRWSGGYSGPERRSRRSQRIKPCILCTEMVSGECTSTDCSHRSN